MWLGVVLIISVCSIRFNGVLQKSEVCSLREFGMLAEDVSTTVIVDNMICHRQRLVKRCFSGFGGGIRPVF